MKGGFAGALLVALTDKLCLDFLGLRVQQFKNSSLGFGAWIRETSSPAVCLNHDQTDSVQRELLQEEQRVRSECGCEEACTNAPPSLTEGRDREGHVCPLIP